MLHAVGERIADDADVVALFELQSRAPFAGTARRESGALKMRATIACGTRSSLCAVGWAYARGVTSCRRSSGECSRCGGEIRNQGTGAVLAARRSIRQGVR